MCSSSTLPSQKSMYLHLHGKSSRITLCPIFYLHITSRKGNKSARGHHTSDIYQYFFPIYLKNFIACSTFHSIHGNLKRDWSSASSEKTKRSQLNISVKHGCWFAWAFSIVWGSTQNIKLCVFVGIFEKFDFLMHLLNQFQRTSSIFQINFISSFIV